MDDHNTDMASRPRLLRRSRRDRVIFGVCGGLGEYFNVDPVILRIAFVVLAFIQGIGIVAYLVAALVMPTEPEGAEAGFHNGSNVSAPLAGERGSGNGPIILGAVLVIVGAIALLSNLNLFWWFDVAKLWPLILIALGVALLDRRYGR